MPSAPAAPALPARAAPRPRSAAASSRPLKAKGRGASAPPLSLLSRAFARPGVTAAGAVFAAVMTGIVANAVMFQRARHPSPLFTAPVPQSAPVAAPMSRATIVPAPAAPVAASAPQADLQPAPTPLPLAKPKPHAKPHAATVTPVPAAVPRKPAASPHGADAIGQLLRTGPEASAAKLHGKPAHPVVPVARSIQGLTD